MYRVSLIGLSLLLVSFLCIGLLLWYAISTFIDQTGPIAPYSLQTRWKELAVAAFAIAVPIVGLAATASGVFFGWRKDRREVKRAALANRELELKIKQLERTLSERDPSVA